MLSPILNQFIEILQLNSFTKLHSYILRNSKQSKFKMLLFFVCLILPLTISPASVSQVYSLSTLFQCDNVNFMYFPTANIDQTVVVTYNSSLMNTNLKLPCLGITGMNYNTSTKEIYLLMSIANYSVSGANINILTKSASNLAALSFRYFVVDGAFTSPISTNAFTRYSIGATGPGINLSILVNFTASSNGFTVNTSNNIIISAFTNFIDLTTPDNNIDIGLSFALLNQSFYSVAITSSAAITLKQLGYSRIMFDVTAAQVLTSEYFSYGTFTSTNNNLTQLTLSLPPVLMASNFFMGMLSFTFSNQASFNFNASYAFGSGSVSITPSSFTYSKFTFSYFSHIMKTCPSSNPYFQQIQSLCYDVCPVRFYTLESNMACLPCTWDCYTCTNYQNCTTCSSTIDFRSLSDGRCYPIIGYLSNGSIVQAIPCTSPCQYCSGRTTNCTSCVTGYFLNVTTCIACNLGIPNCNQCTNASLCTLCANGGTGITCTTCGPNQILVSGACKPCSNYIANCYSCSSTSNCTYCNTNTTLSTTWNTCSCLPNEYYTGTVCVLCNSTYLYSVSCTSTSVTTCMSTFNKSTSTTCVCQAGYFINSSYIPFCQRCNTSYLLSMCFECNDGCNSTKCTQCYTNFVMNGQKCVCPLGTYYLTYSTSTCTLCSTTFPGCQNCTNGSACETCLSNYYLNYATGGCVLISCIVANCKLCPSGNSVCSQCITGYSLASNKCSSYCGNGYFNNLTEQCDDFNLINGDGCSSTCTVQASFQCYMLSNGTSSCFYAQPLTFTKIFIQKIAQENSLLLCIQFDQKFAAWTDMNFNQTLSVVSVDSQTFTPLFTNQVSSYSFSSYDPAQFNLYVSLSYSASLQGQYIKVSLNPYIYNSSYAVLRYSPNYEGPPTQMSINLQIYADNNQNANYYSSYEYDLGNGAAVSSWIIVVVGLTFLAACLFFRTGLFIAIEMINMIQISYFSLAALSYMNPVFVGMLPLRVLSGLFNFDSVTKHLLQTNVMTQSKGLFLYGNLINNFNVLLLILIVLSSLGGLLFLVYLLLNKVVKMAKEDDENVEEFAHLQSKADIAKRISLFILGEVNIVILQLSLPLFAFSFFNELFYMGNSTFLSIGSTLVFFVFLAVYFMILLKASYSKSQSKFGDFLAQFNEYSCFQIVKFYNLLMLLTVFMCGFIMLYVFIGGKVFSCVSVIAIATIQIIIISIAKPYKYGFASCWVDQKKNPLGKRFQKFQLFNKIKNKANFITEMSMANKKDEMEAEMFDAHFQKDKQDKEDQEEERKAMRRFGQGQVMNGDIIMQPSLFVFSNNTRQCINLITLILNECILIFVKLGEDVATQNTDDISFGVLMPYAILILISVNMVYNGMFIALEVKSKFTDTNSKVANEAAAEAEENRDTLIKLVQNHNIKRQQQRDPKKHKEKERGDGKLEIIVRNGQNLMSIEKKPRIIANRAPIRKKKDSQQKSHE